MAFEVEEDRWSFIARPGQGVEATPGDRLAGRRLELAVGER